MLRTSIIYHNSSNIRFHRFLGATTTTSQSQAASTPTRLALSSSPTMPARINVPPLTRALLGALTTQSFLSAAIRFRQWTTTSEIVIPYLTLIPQLSLVYPWTLLSTTLVESNIFSFAIAAATLFYGGRYLERAWSSAELAKFLVIVSLVPNLLTFAVLVLFFTLTRNERWT